LPYCIIGAFDSPSKLAKKKCISYRVLIFVIDPDFWLLTAPAHLNPTYLL